MKTNMTTMKKVTQPAASVRTTLEQAGTETTHGKSLWTEAKRRFLANKGAVICLVILVVLLAAFILGPMISPYQYAQTNWSAIFHAPSFSGWHLFGTDNLGRDLFVRSMEGGRITMLIALLATIMSIIVGVIYGAIAGFIGGYVDMLMMRIVDVLYSLPFLFFVILLMTLFGRNFFLMFVAIGAISWLDMARIVRGQTLSLKTREFIEAAEVAGTKTFTTIRRHIVPNLLGVVVVYATLTVPTVILTAGFLSFLGLGVQEPMTSLGLLVNDGSQNMNVAWWTLVFPGVILVAILYCLNYVGDGLRDAFDPKHHFGDSK